MSRCILTLLSFIICSIAFAQNQPATAAQDYAKVFEKGRQEKLDKMKKDFAQKVKENEEALRQGGGGVGAAPQGPPPAPPGGTTGPMGATQPGPPGSSGAAVPLPSANPTNVPGTLPPNANIYLPSGPPPPPPPTPQARPITPPTAAGSSQLPPANTNIYR